jgi:bifunctional non-homologous end joining protein LigD
MLACAGPLPADDGRWAFEVKWDGLRGLALVTGGEIRVRSRSKANLTALFPELSAPVAGLAGRTVLLDGELIVADPSSGRPDFSRVSRRLGCAPLRAAQLARTEPATFVAFDLLWLDGRPMLDEVYAERRAALDGLGLVGDRWVTSPSYFSGAGLWQATAAQQLEGVVAKRWTSRYYPGRRSRAWIKAKHWQHGSFPIIGWRPGRNGRIDALLVATRAPEGTLRYAGTVEWGLPPTLRATLRDALVLLSRPACPLTLEPPVTAAGWVDPYLTLRVRFQSWTPDGLLRHPLGEAVHPSPRPVRA